jgi:hypothetical protein
VAGFEYAQTIQHIVPPSSRGLQERLLIVQPAYVDFINWNPLTPLGHDCAFAVVIAPLVSKMLTQNNAAPLRRALLVILLTVLNRFFFTFTPPYETDC